MKISQQQAVEILTQLGFTMAKVWKAPELQKKLAKLPVYVSGQDPEIEDEELLDLIERIVAEIEEGGTITVSEDKKPAVATKKTTAKPKAEAEEPEEEEDEDEEEDEEEDEAPPPKKKGGKAVKPKKQVVSKKTKPQNQNGQLRNRVGVVETIIDNLEKATEQKPLSREKMVEILKKKFPDRPEKGMKHTVYVQLAVPEYGLAKRGFKILSNPKGYFLKPGKVKK